MNIQTHQMDPRIAGIYYKDYRKKVREHRSARLAAAQKQVAQGGKIFRAGRTARSLIEKEDEALMLSYREMARGNRLLNIEQVMGGMGVEATGTRLPILAIAQADWTHVHAQISNQRVVFSKDQWFSWNYHRERFNDGAVGIPMRAYPAELWNEHWRRGQNLPVLQHKALVPAIPAMLRPAGNLAQYHILFEAKWEHVAPPDPLLLRHVVGSIYTVLAQWDLTPVEKMVLEGRSRSS
jgi:hypothetical protein